MIARPAIINGSGKYPKASAMRKAASSTALVNGGDRSAALRSRLMAASGSQSLKSKKPEPTVPYSLCKGFLVVIRICPCSPPGKHSLRSVWLLSVWSIIRSQGFFCEASQSFAARSFGSLPALLAILENVSLVLCSELPSIQKTPQNL